MLDDNTVFDDLLMGRCHDIVNVTNIIFCLNQKVIESAEDKRKVEVLTEVLNDIKLLLVPVYTELEH